MIVRILTEGQYDVPEAEVDGLNALDDAVHAAIDGGDQVRFSEALSALLAEVRRVGEPVHDHELKSSDAILPPADATLDEAQTMLQPDGLIPG